MLQIKEKWDLPNYNVASPDINWNTCSSHHNINRFTAEQLEHTMACILKTTSVLPTGCIVTSLGGIGGYGRTRVSQTLLIKKSNKREELSSFTHVISACFFLGKKLPENVDVSHLCGHKKCLNPKHLVIESRKGNLTRNSCHQLKKSCHHFIPCIISESHNNNNNGKEEMETIPGSPIELGQWELEELLIVTPPLGQPAELVPSTSPLSALPSAPLSAPPSAPLLAPLSAPLSAPPSAPLSAPPLAPLSALSASLSAPPFTPPSAQPLLLSTQPLKYPTCNNIWDFVNLLQNNCVELELKSGRFFFTSAKIGTIGANYFPFLDLINNDITHKIFGVDFINTPHRITSVWQEMIINIKIWMNNLPQSHVTLVFCKHGRSRSALFAFLLCFLCLCDESDSIQLIQKKWNNSKYDNSYFTSTARLESFWSFYAAIKETLQ